MITSTSNAQVRAVARLRDKARERRQRDLYLAEGPKMLEEAPRGMVEAVYASEHFASSAQGEKLLKSSPVPTEIVSDAVFREMSDTQTPQGVICVMRRQHYLPEDLLGRVDTRTFPGEAADRDPAGPEEGSSSAGQSFAIGEDVLRAPLCMVLENLQDPGNLGTIVRTAEGAGVTGILLSSGCVDIYNPKVIRSTMGSIFRVPFCYTEDLAGTLKQWQNRGIRLYAAHLGGSLAYDREDYTGPSAFLIGNEAGGLTEETAALADRKIRIPMCGRVESLNAAVAASILMYEAARQRRNR